MQQYDTIEELTLELALYPNKKIDILKDCAKECEYGWFAVAKDGNCALFDDNGNLDDIDKVKSIDEDMIPKDIEKISIPDSVTSIQDGAFDGCSRLVNVMIGENVTSIGGYAFMWCSGLTSMMIPDSVTSIGDQAFSYCSGFTRLTIPNSVMSIGNYAFSGCSGLVSMTILDSVTNIGYEVFFGCSNLKELVFKGKTIEEVKSMENYPWKIRDESIIRCEG